jgi:hypothetical protein
MMSMNNRIELVEHLHSVHWPAPHRCLSVLKYFSCRGDVLIVMVGRYTMAHCFGDLEWKTGEVANVSGKYGT